MGYSLLAIGDVVRINAGEYAGLLGVVEPPAIDAEQYETGRQPAAMLFPVTVAIVVDGVSNRFRIPADCLTRVEDRWT